MFAPFFSQTLPQYSSSVRTPMHSTAARESLDRLPGVCVCVCVRVCCAYHASRRHMSCSRHVLGTCHSIRAHCTALKITGSRFMSIDYCPRACVHLLCKSCSLLLGVGSISPTFSLPQFLGLQVCPLYLLAGSLLCLHMRTPQYPSYPSLPSHNTLTMTERGD